MTDNLHNMDDRLLLEEMKLAEIIVANEQAKIKQIKDAIYQRNKQYIDDTLKAKAEPFGVVNLAIGKFKVTVDTPKKVEWDQQMLEDLFKQIEADGADPKEFIKVKLEVSETAYKAWPSNIKEYFTPARTVKAGNPGIKAEEIA